MANYPVLTGEMVNEWLKPETVTNPIFTYEEKLHPWKPSPVFQSIPGPLLRTWDRHSGSQPTEESRMFSRDPEMRLSDRETRRTTLAKSLYHNDWTTPGPYIAFKSSQAGLEDLARLRIGRKRGPQTVTAINPNVRIKKGLPVLNVQAEMRHYDIPAPKGYSDALYEDDYVCLWQVTKAEIIGQWDWSDLEDNPSWFQDVVLPAYNRSMDAIEQKVFQVPNDPEPLEVLLGGFQNLSIANNSAGSSVPYDDDDEALSVSSGSDWTDRLVEVPYSR